MSALPTPEVPPVVSPENAAPGAEAPIAAPSLSAAELAMLCESLLFVAPTPIPAGRLAQALGVAAESVEAALATLQTGYAEQKRGLRLLRKGDRVQLTSAPEAATYIERFLGLDLNTRLSPAALETLAVIAYRQPITRGDIEAVRGVGCDGVLRTLLARSLVEPVGRLEQAGRPFLYGTTVEFLQYFGLDSLDRLPPLPESAN